MKLNVKDYQNHDIIRILREYSNMTQKQLAKHLSKHVRTIQRYETGDIKIDLEVLREICKICDVNLTIESKLKRKSEK